MANHFGSINLLSNGNKLELYAAPTLAANYSIGLPPTAPNNGQTIKFNSVTGLFEWDDLAQEVNIDLGITAPNEFNITGSPYIGGSSTIAFNWVNQTQNRVFASPNGVLGVPSFRSLVDADLPSIISASKINGLLSFQNIPGGTNATQFQINAGNSGIILKNETGLKVLNNDLSLADLYCATLHVLNGIDQSNVTTVNLGDSILQLVSGFTTGVPSVNAGFTVRRGSSVNATLQWNETNDLFEAGTNDNLKIVARKSYVEITNASLTSGDYVFNHNLKERYPVIQVVDNLNRSVGVNVTFNTINSCTIHLNRLAPITGTYYITAIG